MTDIWGNDDTPPHDRAFYACLPPPEWEYRTSPRPAPATALTVLPCLLAAAALYAFDFYLMGRH